MRWHNFIPLCQLLLLLITTVRTGWSAIEFSCTQYSSYSSFYKADENMPDFPKTVCSFFKLKTLSRSGTVLSYGTKTRFRKIEVEDFKIKITVDREVHEYDASLLPDTWQHFCYVEDGNPLFYLGGAREPSIRSFTLSSSQYSRESNFFFIGALPSTQNSDTVADAISGSLAQVQAWTVPLNKTQVESVSSCQQVPGQIDHKLSDVLQQRAEWLPFNDLRFYTIGQSQLCEYNFDIVVLSDGGNYDQMRLQCRNMNGDFLSADERSNSRQQLLEKRSDCRVNDVHYTWLSEGGNKVHGAGDMCPILSTTKGIMSKSCLNVIKCSLCVIRTFKKFRLYGEADNSDRIFHLELTNEGNFSLKGVQSSSLSLVDKKWVLKSGPDGRSWTKRTFGSPFGRMEWENRDEIRIFTFSSCKYDEFACDNGTCIQIEYRCNGVKDCSDNSDELNCMVLYKGDQRPPSTAEATQVTHKLKLRNANGISPQNPFLQVEMELTFTWQDPRNEFGNLAKTQQNNQFDCNLTWHPGLRFLDGFEMDAENSPYSQICEAQYVSGKTVKPIEDPYMTLRTPGLSLPVHYRVGIRLETPCMFEFSKYPFDIQQCRFSVRMYNGGKAFKFRNESAREIKSRVSQRNFREYKLLKMTQESNKDEIKVVVNLRKMFGQHLICEFAPTSFTLIIAISTFFYPLVDFGNRILVSVLCFAIITVLFMLNTMTSSQISGIKLIDVWYLALAFLCFLIVVFMTVINRLRSKEELQPETKLFQVRPFTDGEDEKVPKRKKKCCSCALSCNLICLIIILGLTAVFMATYWFLIYDFFNVNTVEEVL